MKNKNYPDMIVTPPASTGDANVSAQPNANEKNEDEIHKDVVLFVHFFVALVASSYILAVI